MDGKTGYIYVITNYKKDHKRYKCSYVGQRTVKIGTDIEQDPYMGSSYLLKKDIKNLSLDYFEKEILESGITDLSLLYERERFWIKELGTFEFGYNRSDLAGNICYAHRQLSLAYCQNQNLAGLINEKLLREYAEQRFNQAIFDSFPKKQNS